MMDGGVCLCVRFGKSSYMLPGKAGGDLGRGIPHGECGRAAERKGV